VFGWYYFPKWKNYNNYPAKSKLKRWPKSNTHHKDKSLLNYTLTFLLVVGCASAPDNNINNNEWHVLVGGHLIAGNFSCPMIITTIITNHNYFTARKNILMMATQNYSLTREM
jgi:hypothetical protein